MKKWAVSALVYLLLIVGGYTVYSQVFQSDEKASNEKSESHNSHETAEPADTHGEHEETSTESDSHDEHGEGVEGSEVNVDVAAENNSISIMVKDTDGNPVDELDINHEKLLHLIIVGSDMEIYKHLHPEKTSEGTFKVNHDLVDGSYKAFVDIKPTNKSYHVEAISFNIGEQDADSHHAKLIESEKLSVESGSHQVTLNPSTLKSGEEVELHFDLNGEVPEQYLGALGHVVILDAHAEEYLHVHPLEGEDPIFATSFAEPGLYKVWAEFKFDGEVFVFPYVVNVN
jgi:hypothetical protein